MDQTVKWVIVVIIVVLIIWFGLPYLQNSDTPENGDTATTTPENTAMVPTVGDVMGTTTDEVTTETPTEEDVTE